MAALGGRQLVESDECELFDAETGKWSRLPQPIRQRAFNPAVVAVQRGAAHRLYAIGGHINGKESLDSCEFLDIGDDQWTLIEARLEEPRSVTCAVLLDHTTVVICGGHNDLSTLRLCESLDLNTHTFSPFPDMLEHRCAHAGVHYNGTIVVLGGLIVTGKRGYTDETATCEQFDPAVFKWTPFASLHECRKYFGAAVVEGKIYAASACFATDSVEVYDGSAWSIVTRMPGKTRCWISPVALGGKLVITKDTGEVDAYDPATKLWSVLPSMIPGDHEYVAAISF